MRGWHHQLAHLNIHKDWSRSVFGKNMKFQNVITSLFLIRFSSFLHCSVGKIFLFLLTFIKFWTGFPLQEYAVEVMSSLPARTWHAYLQNHDASANTLLEAVRHFRPVVMDAGSRGTTAHAHQCCIFQSYAKTVPSWMKLTMREPASITTDKESRHVTSYFYSAFGSRTFALWHNPPFPC